MAQQNAHPALDLIVALIDHIRSAWHTAGTFAEILFATLLAVFAGKLFI